MSIICRTNASSDSVIRISLNNTATSIITNYTHFQKERNSPATQIVSSLRSSGDKWTAWPRERSLYIHNIMKLPGDEKRAYAMKKREWAATRRAAAIDMYAAKMKDADDLVAAADKDDIKADELDKFMMSLHGTMDFKCIIESKDLDDLHDIILALKIKHHREGLSATEKRFWAEAKHHFRQELAKLPCVKGVINNDIILK